MVQSASTMMELGTIAPAFSLPDTNGKMVSSKDFKDTDALLVMFICNHCPFVKHLAPQLAKLANDYEGRGLAVVGINSNDAEKYPDDGPEKMKEEVAARGYTFPYLFDADQSVAKSYHAACTPDFFLFDRWRRLIYRGQFDESRPGNDVPVTGKDLRHAIDTVLTGATISLKQKPSIGCNIKWKPGNEPDYFRPA